MANEPTINVGDKERLASLAGGGALVAAGLMRRGLGGYLLAFVGGTLMYRGATGHCSVCAAMNKGTKPAGKRELSRDVPGHGGILVEKSVTVDKSPEELYAFWRKLENLPRIMQHLETVIETDATHSNWIAKAPAGTTVSWGAEIIRDEPNHYIAWRSLENSDVANSGSVRFVPNEQGNGTIVRVIFEYKPPAGALGAVIAKLFGEEPNQQVESDLMRFKELMESGEAGDD